MQVRRVLVATVCGMALAAAGTWAEETKKKQAPEAKAQPAESGATAPAKATEPGEPGDGAEKAGEQPKAAVNTIEDLFAAYGMTWTPSVQPVAGTPDESVVWKEAAPARPALKKKPAAR